MVKHTMHNAGGMVAHVYPEIETVMVVVEMGDVAMVVELIIVIIWDQRCWW